jgi:hypothetical protein
VGNDQLQAQRAVAAEQASKQRSTLIAELERIATSG